MFDVSCSFLYYRGGQSSIKIFRRFSRRESEFFVTQRYDTWAGAAHDEILELRIKSLVLDSINERNRHKPAMHDTFILMILLLGYYIIFARKS